MRCSCALFFAIALAVAPAQAKSLYVSHARVASDENSGSRALPLRSIGRAVALVEPGDEIIVSAGDYRQEQNGYGIGVIPLVDIDASDAPILVRAGQGVLVKKFFIQNSSGITVTGFQVRGESVAQFPNWRPMPMVVRDQSFAESPDFTQPYASRQARIEEEFATYFALTERLGYESGIDIENSSLIRIQENRIHGYFAGIQCRGAQSVRIIDNLVSNCVNGIFTFRPGPALENALIHGNRIAHSLDNGIDIRANSSKVRIIDNSVTYSGRAHISLQEGVTDTLVHGNYVFAGGFYSETMKYPGSSAISVNGCSTGIRIVRNIVVGQTDQTGIDGNGIILDLMQDGASVVVKRNRLVDNEGAGLNTTISPNAIISQNDFFYNGFGVAGDDRGAAIKLSRQQDINQTIVDNRFYLNRVGIRSYRTIEQQLQVDRNFYVTVDWPLIWDGISDDDRAYFSTAEVQVLTGWEQNGVHIPRSY